MTPSTNQGILIIVTCKQQMELLASHTDKTDTKTTNLGVYEVMSFSCRSIIGVAAGLYQFSVRSLICRV